MTAYVPVSPGRQPRRTRRRALGFSLVEVMIVVVIVAVISGIAVAVLVKAKGSAEDGSALGTLRAIQAAQSTAEGTVGRHLPISDLVARGMLDSSFNDVPITRHGYTFTEVVDAGVYTYYARPINVQHGVRRYLLTPADGIIRYTDTGTDPDGTSPVLGVPL